MSEARQCSEAGGRASYAAMLLWIHEFFIFVNAKLIQKKGGMFGSSQGSVHRWGPSSTCP